MTYFNASPTTVTRAALGREVDFNLYLLPDWDTYAVTTPKYAAARDYVEAEVLADDPVGYAKDNGIPGYEGSSEVVYGVKIRTEADLPQAMVDAIVAALDDKTRTPSAIAKRASAKSRYGAEVDVYFAYVVLDGLDKVGLTTNKGNGQHRRYAAPAI